MQRRSGVLGLVATACLLFAHGVQAQVSSQEGTLFGAHAEDSIFTLFPAITDTNQLSQSTLEEPGPLLSPLTPRRLRVSKRQEHGAWSRVLIGAGIGLVAGFGLGWAIDAPEDCLLLYADSCDLGVYASGYFWRVTLAPVGAGLGGLAGWWFGR